MNSFKKTKIKSTLKTSIMELPTPSSISYLWNWGSLLGIALIVQLLTGIMLASHYNSDVEKSFESVTMMMRNINFGYQIRFIHMNMAGFFFICLFTHVSRSMFTSSFKLKNTWMSGTTMILLLMGTAFLGYVLPWGQMSFWGATVITNLLSAIPFVGKMIVEWLWGGFSIGKATLNRFFTLHFLMPFLLTMMTLIHLTFLHQTGSNKPLGSNQKMDMMNFHPFFSSKDIPTALIIFTTLLLMSMTMPFIMGDPENFNMANPLNTPIHIQPEWYFLFAYAILRSIPSKLGGVIALLMSIMSLYLLVMLKKTKSSKKWMPNMKNIFWVFISTFLSLTWIGAMPVEAPFENIGKTLSMMYFPSLFSLCFKNNCFENNKKV